MNYLIWNLHPSHCVCGLNAEGFVCPHLPTLSLFLKKALCVVEECRVFTYRRRWKPTVVCTLFTDGGIWRKEKNCGCYHWCLIFPYTGWPVIGLGPLHLRVLLCLAPICWRPCPTVGWEPLPIVIVIGLGNCTTAPMPFVPRVAKNFDGPELLACGHQTNTDHIFLVHLTSTRPLALEIK